MALTKVTSGVRTIATDEVVTASIADDAVTTAKIADDAVGVAQLSATGTASATTFLRGDNAWAAPAGLVSAGTDLVQNPIAIGTSVTQAHGLGAAPTFFKWRLECLTAELNYLIGDVLDMTSWSATSSGNWFAPLVVDATNFTLISGNASISIYNKTTYALSVLTPANWKLTITPYKVT
tara:strand:+ start:1820 stop:2356 length:537 start_codon:yes stop_codon:yes gene_type:complete